MAVKCKICGRTITAVETRQYSYITGKKVHGCLDCSDKFGDWIDEQAARQEFNTMVWSDAAREVIEQQGVLWGKYEDNVIAVFGENVVIFDGRHGVRLLSGTEHAQDIAQKVRSETENRHYND